MLVICYREEQNGCPLFGFSIVLIILCIFAALKNVRNKEVIFFSSVMLQHHKRR